MILKSALKNHMGEQVKIGAASSYIFCGTMDESVWDVFTRHDKIELRRLQKILGNIRKRDETFDKVWNGKLELKLKTFNKSALRNKWDDEMILAKHKKLMQKFNECRDNDRARVDKLLQMLPQKITHYVPISERKVKEEYESIEGGTIIIFDGLEVGTYWTYDEYKERNQ